MFNNSKLVSNFYNKGVYSLTTCTRIVAGILLDFIKYTIKLSNSKNNIESLIFSDPSLAGGDTLTCGDCKRDFKLQELTLFIQHKAQNACKKLKLQTNFESDVNDKVKSSSPKDRGYVSVGSPSVSGSGKKCSSRNSQIIPTSIYFQAKQSVILTAVKTTRLRSRKKTPTLRNICSLTPKQILFLHQVSSTYFTNEFHDRKSL